MWPRQYVPVDLGVVRVPTGQYHVTEAMRLDVSRLRRVPCPELLVEGFAKTTVDELVEPITPTLRFRIEFPVGTQECPSDERAGTCGLEVEPNAKLGPIRPDGAPDD